MPATDGLPDPVVIVATSVFGWYPVPLDVLLVTMWVVAGVALVAAITAVLAPRIPGVGLAAQTLATLPVGLALPSLFWQVGDAGTPAQSDVTGDTDFAHITLAILIIVLPLAAHGVGAWRGAYTYRGPADRGRRTFQVGAPGPERMFLALALRLHPAAARELAAQVLEQLRFHTAYLGVPTTYQFVMPNGALLSITDAAVGGRRALVMGGRVPRGYSRVIGTFTWPRGVPERGGWFAGDETAALASLTRWCILAFRNQDDEKRGDAIVLDPAAALVRR